MSPFWLFTAGMRKCERCLLKILHLSRCCVLFESWKEPEVLIRDYLRLVVFRHSALPVPKCFIGLFELRWVVIFLVLGEVFLWGILGKSLTGHDFGARPGTQGDGIGYEVRA